MKMNPELVKNLNIFGLSDYEAKAYGALVSLGTGSVTEVSQLCDVPRSNLYSVLEKLNKKGFVDIQRGRPILFKAIDPKKVLKEVEREKGKETEKAKENALKELNKLYAEEKKGEEPALIWGVRGYDAVMRKIIEIIRRSKKEVLVNIPNISIFDGEVFEELRKAKNRKVKIKIAAEHNKILRKFKSVALIRTRDKIHGIDIVADEKEIIIAPQIPIVAAWLDNPEMALHVKDFLELIWKDAKVMK